MRVRINNEVYTLITIVAETATTSVFSATEIRAVAYVFDKDRKVKKFTADQITDVEK